MSDKQTKEKQYQFLLEHERGEEMGLMSSQVWRDDPRRLVFLLSRYKFVAKMFSGLPKVLEVGCADAFGSRIVKQEVGELVATDFDPIFIEDASTRIDPNWPIELRVHNILAGPVEGAFDGVYCCDVLEHIEPPGRASLHAQSCRVHHSSRCSYHRKPFARIADLRLPSQ